MTCFLCNIEYPKHIYLIHDYNISTQQIQTCFSGPKFSVAGSITIKGAVFHFPALIPVYCIETVTHYVVKNQAVLQH